MKERGLTFCQELVGKVLDGSKFVTRRLGGLRLVNGCPDNWRLVGWREGPNGWAWQFVNPSWHSEWIKCPQGVAGDRFYMQEAWGLLYPGTHKPYNLGAEAYKSWIAELENSVGLGMREPSGPLIPVYKASAPSQAVFTLPRWRSGRFQPKWAARPQRWELISIRPERVQNITIEDIIAEGLSSDLIEHDACVDLREQFEALWDSINAGRGYAFERNNWVWRKEWNPKPVVE